uniref:Uncharacterized protein n=1 Tax=Anguilla anguilla TaxID=7936 RepID=A0A0E9TV04_ANGAN
MPSLSAIRMVTEPVGKATSEACSTVQNCKRKINDGTLCWRRPCLSGERVNKRPGSLWPLEILPTLTHNHNLEA